MWPFKTTKKQTITPEQLKEGLNTLFGTKKQTITPEQLKEGLNTLFGTPVDFGKLMAGPQGQPTVPIWFRDPHQYKPLSVRTYADFQRIRSFSRWLWENNGWAESLVRNATNFVIGQGINCKVLSDQYPELANQVQSFIDNWNEESDIYRIQQETFQRTLYDGEVFIRHYPDLQEETKIRFIEPDSILPGTGQDWEGEWSFGIKTPIDDWETPLEYAVWYYDNKFEKIPAHLVSQLKVNVRRNVKRGLPIFMKFGMDLYELDQLHQAFRQGEIARQKIAYVEEFQAADQSTVRALHDAETTDTYWNMNQYGNQYEVDLQHMEAGSKLQVPKSKQYKEGPAGQGAANIEIATNLAIKKMAGATGFPAWMFNQDTESAAYASAVVLDSSLRRTVEAHQNIQIDYWTKIYKTILGFEINKGKLPENLFELIDLALIAPNPNSRNKKDEIEADLLLVNQGIMSDETLAARNNLNLEEELKKGAKKNGEDLNINASKDGTNNPKLNGEEK